MSKILPGFCFWIWSSFLSFLKNCLLMVFPCLVCFLREGLPAVFWLCPDQSSSQEDSRLPHLCGVRAGALPTGAEHTTSHRGSLQPSSGGRHWFTLCCTFVTTLVICIYSIVRDGSENIPVEKISQRFLLWDPVLGFLLLCCCSGNWG